jgi:hypothetical protein
MKRNKVAAVGFVLLVCAPLTAQPTTPVEASAPLTQNNGSTPDSGGAIRVPKTEFGAKLGQGAFLTAHGAFTAVGVEACVRCQGRIGYFLEFTHWSLTPTGGQTSLLNLGGGGFRIQSKNKHVRPFLDIGIAVGTYDGHPHNYVHKDESFDIMGLMLGFGMTVSLPKGFYVRPQARLAISPETGVGFGSVGLGYRF